MKKVLAIILSICFIFCLTACNKDNTTSDVMSDNSQITPTENQTSDLTTSNESTESSEPTESSRPTESSKPAESNKPAESSKPTHTHSYSAATCTTPQKCSCGETKSSALGHKWQDATCKAPKTCSVCKATEGNKVEHIVEGTTCKWCKQPVVVSPSKLKNKSYSSLSEPFKLPDDWDTGAKYGITVSTLDFEYNGFCGGDMYSEYIPRPDYTPSEDSLVYYEGKAYHSDTQWYAAAEFEKQISNNRIILLFDGGSKGKIEFELLSNDTLRVVSVSGKWWTECVRIGGIYS